MSSAPDSKTVWFQISWILMKLMKPADLNLHCFGKGVISRFSNANLRKKSISMCGSTVVQLVECQSLGSDATGGVVSSSKTLYLHCLTFKAPRKKCI